MGISSVTPSAPYAYKIADNFREKNKTVVLGGYHPSSLPEEAKEHADAVVVGEAEYLWPQILKDFENGTLKSFYKSQMPIDAKSIPTPIRETSEIRAVPL